MSSKFFWIACSAGVALWLAPGCQICGDGAICRDSSEKQGSELCQSFCSRLADCDDLGGTSESDCVSSCDAQCAHGGSAAEKGAQCVVDASCHAINAKSCSGAPFPSGGSTSGATGSASTSGSSGYGGSSSTTSTSSGSGAGGATTSGTTSSGGGQTGAGTTTSSSTSGGPVPCVVNCDCPSGDVCYQGFCAVYKP